MASSGEARGTSLTVMLNFLFLAVVGLIGTGKSTMMNALEAILTSSGYRVFVLYENLDAIRSLTVDGETVNPLDLQGPDPHRFQGVFQIYTYASRARQHRDGLAEARAWADENPGTPVIVIAERCGACDRIFFDVGREAGQISTLDAGAYEAVATCFSFPTPDLFVYLRADPAVCYERVHRRGRHEETADWLLPYLEALHRHHDKAYLESGRNTLTIDNSADLASTLLTRTEHPHAHAVHKYVARVV